VHVTADQLLDVASTGGSATEVGLHNNLYIAVAYIATWLSGNGAVAIRGLMEDAATAEISRSQVWQQLRNATVLADSGRVVTPELVREALVTEMERLRGEVTPERFSAFYEPAARLVEDICLSVEYTEFLTLPAYEMLG
jgi:malate synthase